MEEKVWTAGTYEQPHEVRVSPWEVTYRFEFDPDYVFRRSKTVSHADFLAGAWQNEIAIGLGPRVLAEIVAAVTNVDADPLFRHAKEDDAALAEEWRQVPKSSEIRARFDRPEKKALWALDYPAASARFDDGESFKVDLRVDRGDVHRFLFLERARREVPFKGELNFFLLHGQGLWLMTSKELAFVDSNGDRGWSSHGDTRLRGEHRFTTVAYASDRFGAYVSSLHRPYTATQRELGSSGLWVEVDTLAGIVAREAPAAPSEQRRED